jgi:putative transposase
MPSYRRNYDGDIFFFTLVTASRRTIFRNQRARDLLSSAIRETRREKPWKTIAIVLLPDHLHTIWRMPEHDKDFSVRIAAIKKRFTRAYLAAGGREARVPTGQARSRRRGVWQRKFWEHTIRDAKDFRKHLDYIHMNPVKHGLVERPGDWAASSFHRCVEEGWYEPNWFGPVDLPGTVEYLMPE